MRHHANFYTNRLVKEWLKNGKIIIGCDLDDTIIPYNEEIKERLFNGTALAWLGLKKEQFL